VADMAAGWLSVAGASTLWASLCRSLRSPCLELF
jgi:hypothetical protein